MKLTYDPTIDVAYLDFVPSYPGRSKETVPLLPEQTGGHMINLDFDAKGKLVGIEILDASTVLPVEVLKTASSPAHR